MIEPRKQILGVAEVVKKTEGNSGMANLEGVAMSLLSGSESMARNKSI